MYAGVPAKRPYKITVSDWWWLEVCTRLTQDQPAGLTAQHGALCTEFDITCSI